MKQYSLVFSCLFLSVLLTNCKKKGERLPLVTTLNASIVSATAINCGGVLYFTGDGELLQCGLCWATQPEPTIDNNITDAGAEEGNFSQTITGLLPNKTYYIRAFATNEHGTSYGKVMTAQTPYENVNSVTDIDGNVYGAVKIGSKVWTTENLRVTRYRNGTLIDYLPNSTNWSVTFQGAYCYYLNNALNKSQYGILYNWFAVSDPRSIAPAGWHVATYSDYNDLILTLGGTQYAGGKMKAVHSTWTNNYGASNTSGFTAYPGGQRSYDGQFSYINYLAAFWTNSSSGSFSSFYAILYGNSTSADVFSDDYCAGHSVRLVKD